MFTKSFVNKCDFRSFFKKPFPSKIGKEPDICNAEMVMQVNQDTSA